MDPAHNNIAIARARERRRNEFLDVHPATAEQLVFAGIYPTAEKARERCKRGQERGEIAYVGHVTNINGFMEKLYARFEVDVPQHEYGITWLILIAKPDAAR